MRKIGVLVASVVGVTALAVAALGWLRSPDPITAEEAVGIADGALAEAGVDASVADAPNTGTYEPDDGDPIPVWKVVATVEGGTVMLWLAQDGGEPVFLDDRGPSGATHLLSDEAFEDLAAHHANPARDRLLRENIALTLAAAGVLVVTALLVTLQRTRSGPARRTPG